LWIGVKLTLAQSFPFRNIKFGVRPACPSGGNSFANFFGNASPMPFAHPFSNLFANTFANLAIMSTSPPADTAIFVHLPRRAEIRQGCSAGGSRTADYRAPHIKE